MEHQGPDTTSLGEVDDLLDGVADLPLGEQVAVFESVHQLLTERLSERDA